MTDPQHRKRRKKLVDAGLQLRLTGTLVAIACLGTLFQLALLNGAVLRLARRIAEEGEHAVSAVPGILAVNIAVTLLVLFPVMTLVGVLMTHRIAGPAFAIRRYLLRVAEGGAPAKPCRVRKGDELQDLCAAVDLAVERLVTDAGSGEDADAQRAA